jgi:hypothetical protein
LKVASKVLKRAEKKDAPLEPLKDVMRAAKLGETTEPQ